VAEVGAAVVAASAVTGIDLLFVVCPCSWLP
jgi:hypothetical protein